MAYPVTWPGFFTLYRLRTSTPAWSSRAKNSCPLAEAAAAVATSRRSVTRLVEVVPDPADQPGGAYQLGQCVPMYARLRVAGVHR